MTADIYYKIEHTDGREENYHFYDFSDEGVDSLLDLMNDLKGKVKSIHGITRGDFMLNQTDKKGPINICLDLHSPNDALGKKIAYMEHYQL